MARGGESKMVSSDLFRIGLEKKCWMLNMPVFKVTILSQTFSTKQIKNLKKI